MSNQNRHQYDIMLAGVDPSTYKVVEVNVFSDVDQIVAKAAQSPDLGCVLEGGSLGDIYDIDFDSLPDYYPVEIPRHTNWKYNYIAMRGHSRKRFDDAMKEALDHMKKHPTVTAREIAIRTNHYISKVADEYCLRAGISDRALIKDAVMFILDRLQMASETSEEYVDIPDFVLLPRVTHESSPTRVDHGLRAYPETFNLHMNEYDILHDLLSIMKEETFSHNKRMPSMDSEMITIEELDRQYGYVSKILTECGESKEEWTSAVRDMGRHLSVVMKRPPWDDVESAPLELILGEFLVYSYMSLMYVEELQKFLLNHKDNDLSVVDLDRVFELASKTLGVSNPESGQYSYSDARDTLQDKFDPRTPAPISIGFDMGTPPL